MRRTLIMLVAVAALAACGSDQGAGLDWPKIGDPVSADGGLVWADARSGEVHLPDGSVLDAGGSISSFVLAGGGAYVVGEDDALVEVTTDGARTTGAHVDTRVKASPSGRYLAFIDPRSSPQVEGSVHLLTSVVVDLKTGEEVYRSTAGMGDPDTDDLTDLYEDADYGVLAVTDETAWFSVPEGDVLAIDLSTGKATKTRDTDTSSDDNPWVNPQLSPPTIGGPANAGGTWGIYHVSREDPEQSTDPAVTFPHDELESADGTRVVPRPDADNWYFQQWVDDSTVAGFANTGLDDPDRVEQTKDSSLLTCTVPDGDCDVVPDSAHAILPETSLY